MERLTKYDYEQVELIGLNIYAIKEHDADILEKGIRKLAEYEDADMTPEEAINYKAQSIINAIELSAANQEIDFWKRQAIEATAKLGEIRILMEMKGV